MLEKKSKSTEWRIAAFTMIELLMIVAIVSVLCVLVAGGVQSNIKNAKSVLCASQLRQIGVLIQQYAAEHNNELPPSNGSFFSSHVEWGGGWFDPSTPEGPGGGLAAYTDVKSLKELSVCPLRYRSSSRNEEPPIPEGFPYTANYHVLPTSGFSIVRTTSLERPSTVMMLIDSSLDGGWKFGLNSYIESLDEFIGSIHKEKTANVLWVDGHVSAQQVKDIEKRNILP